MKRHTLVARSAAMRKVEELLARAADTTTTVLVTGESGTGKEVVARALHLSSARRGRRFVAVNCGAIPETLIEAELFGHLRGSFTGAVADRRGLFEEADGGTLFLDEIGELPLAMQVKLTRVLQERAVRRVGGSAERKVDVRVIAASNLDLEAAVAAGRFREDLYYRLAIFVVHLPPLRERHDDIAALAELFLERYGARRTPPVDSLSPEALAALTQYGWPGNVRELENAIERAVAVASGERIGLDELPDHIAGLAPLGPSAGDVADLTYHDVIELARDRASRQYLIALMRRFAGNVTQAAARAGVERESLHRLLKRYGVRSGPFKEREA